MKKLLLVAPAVGALLLMNACSELHNTVIPVTGSDTTYLVAPEAATPRNVLVEEYTGVRCTNCPAATAILKNADASNGDRLVIVGLHSGSLTNPIDNLSKDTFQNALAGELMNFFDEDPAKPQATIDRVKQGTKYFTTSGFWLTQINNRLTTPSKQNITITSDYDASNRQAIIKVRASYTSATTGAQKLMVVLTEEDILDAQMFPDSTWEEYEHNHVMRDFLTNVAGDAILQDFPTVEAGRVYERTFVYNVKSKWKAENCRIVAFVFNGEADNREVGQAAEAHLVQ